jgi:nucleotide-binding universal stress UspA family protein
MEQIREIIVPVDFSECSRAAVEEAAWLASRCGAELKLLHVWQAGAFLAPDGVSGAPPTALAFSDLVQRNARQELTRFVAELSARGINVKAAWAEQGQPSRVIVEAAKNADADLLVMGTHGLTGLEHALLGSVVEKVLRRAPCPVLSVRSAAGADFPRDMRRILVPVDYSDGSGLALKAALGFARLVGAELDVVHVWDRPSWMADTMTVQMEGKQRPLGALIRENAQSEMDAFLAAQGISSGLPHRLLSGEPVSTVLGELEAGRHDLVVVGTHGRGGLKHLLLGSVAEKLVRLAKVPVLTIPPPSHARR